MGRLALLFVALAGLVACKRAGEPAAPLVASAAPSPPASAGAPGPEADPCARGGAWTAGPGMAIARGGHAAELLPDDRLLLVGGRTNLHDPEGHATGIEVLDLRPGHDITVHRKAPRRTGHTLTPLPDGRVAIIGGTGADAPKEAQPTWLYAPAGGSWGFPSGPAGTPPVYHAATLLPAGAVMLTGGRANGFPGSPVEATAVVFDPVADTTRELPPLHEARADHTATRLADGSVLVVGGWGKKGLLGDAERYDPGADRWTKIDGAAPREHHTATLLSDGRVLLVGGAEGGGSTQIFDPRTSRFVSTPSPSEPARRHHTATVLAGGAVLVVGGYVAGRGAVAEVALFDPRAGAFCRAPPLSTARSGHTATRLPDGRVVVTGGDNLAESAEPRMRMDPYVRTTEIFQPAP